MRDLQLNPGLELIVLLISAYELPITDRGLVMRAFGGADLDTQESSEAPAAQDARLAPTGCEDCGELLHGLNNALASVLPNAQVMAWKLPSYSRSKRYLHEIERNAQRGGELVKRLLERSQAKCHIGQCPGHTSIEAASVAGFDSVAPTRECNVSSQPGERRPMP